MSRIAAVAALALGAMLATAPPGYAASHTMGVIDIGMHAASGVSSQFDTATYDVAGIGIEVAFAVCMTPGGEGSDGPDAPVGDPPSPPAPSGGEGGGSGDDSGPGGAAQNCIV
jgi:hypothetical protein